MSEVGLDGLPDRPPADGAGDWLLLEEWPLADLADAEVSAGQDHDALLTVLADHAKLVLALSLNLKKTGHMDHVNKITLSKLPTCSKSMSSTSSPLPLLLALKKFSIVDNVANILSKTTGIEKCHFSYHNDSRLVATSQCQYHPCCARSASS